MDRRRTPTTGQRLFGIAVMVGLLVGPPLFVVGALLTDPSASTLQNVVWPYSLGLVAGAVLVGYFWRTGRLDQPAVLSNRDTFLIVSSVAIPLALLLPVIFGVGFRLVVALFFSGFVGPAIPIATLQIVRRMSTRRG